MKINRKIKFDTYYCSFRHLKNNILLERAIGYNNSDLIFCKFYSNIQYETINWYEIKYNYSKEIFSMIKKFSYESGIFESTKPFVEKYLKNVLR
jgi:hypothetical protein